MGEKCKVQRKVQRIPSIWERFRTEDLGRVRKKSGGKRQAYYQSQVTTGKRRTYRLLIAGYFCLRPLTSGFFTGQRPETEIAGNQEPVLPAVPALTCVGDGPALFPPLFFAPSLMLILCHTSWHFILELPPRPYTHAPFSRQDVSTGSNKNSVFPQLCWNISI